MNQQEQGQGQEMANRGIMISLFLLTLKGKKDKRIRKKRIISTL
jgi:hypothetical protein